MGSRGSGSYEKHSRGEFIAEEVGAAVGAGVYGVVRVAEVGASVAAEGVHLASEGVHWLAESSRKGLVAAEHEVEDIAHAAERGLETAARGAHRLGSSAAQLLHKAAEAVDRGVHKVADELQHDVQAVGAGFNRALRHGHEEVEHLAEGASRMRAAARRGIEHPEEVAQELGRVARHAEEAVAAGTRATRRAGARAASVAEGALEHGAEHLGHMVHNARDEERRLSDAFHRGLAYGDENYPDQAWDAGASTRGSLSRSKTILPPSMLAASQEARSRGVHRGGGARERSEDGRAGTQRVRVTIVGAKGIRNEEGASPLCNSYCVCEVPGKKSTMFKTEVAADTSEPLWNVPHEVACSPGDDLQLTVYDKEVWPRQDPRLGRALLPSSEFFPHGFNGELPLGPRHSSVQVIVSVLGQAAPAAGTAARTERAARTPAPRSSGASASNAPVAPSTLARRTEASWRPEAAHGPPSWNGEPQRLKISIRSGRGFAKSVAGTKRDHLYCVCGVVGRPLSRLQTRVSGGAGEPVWNSEHEIPEYIAGDQLEFVIIDSLAQAPMSVVGANSLFMPASDHSIVGSGVLTAEQFFPYGFDSELTLTAPGQGISGLLRVKVVVGDGNRPGTRDLLLSGLAGPAQSRSLQVPPSASLMRVPSASQPPASSYTMPAHGASPSHAAFAGLSAMAMAHGASPRQSATALAHTGPPMHAAPACLSPAVPWPSASAVPARPAAPILGLSQPRLPTPAAARVLQSPSSPTAATTTWPFAPGAPLLRPQLLSVPSSPTRQGFRAHPAHSLAPHAAHPLSPFGLTGYAERGGVLVR